jgi:hypothetical protein
VEEVLGECRNIRGMAGEMEKSLGKLELLKLENNNLENFTGMVSYKC